MGEIMGDKNFGVAILKFLTGDQASASGIMFKPKGDDQLAVQQAARILWQIEQEKGQSKTK